MSPRLPVLVALVAALAGCGPAGVRVDWEPARSAAWIGAGDDDPETRSALVAARAELETGSPARAVDLLGDLTAREPTNLAAARMLQDARLAAGEDPEALAAEARALAERDVYLAPFAPVLAARLEPDPASARRLIEGPLAESGASLAAPGVGRAFRASARHALAWLALAEGDLSGARVQLDAAIELEPGHLEVRKLEAHVLAAGGDLPAARAHLERWLEVAAPEPGVASRDWYDAALDLAIVATGLGRPDVAQEALELLERPRPGTSRWAGPDDATRRRSELLRAVLLAEGGRPEAALEAARAARQGLERGSALYGLSLAQEARLLEDVLGRPAEAAARHAELVERFGEAIDGGSLAAGGDSEFDELLRVLAARVRLARLEAAGVVPAADEDAVGEGGDPSATAPGVIP